MQRQFELHRKTGGGGGGEEWNANLARRSGSQLVPSANYPNGSISGGKSWRVARIPHQANKLPKLEKTLPIAKTRENPHSCQNQRKSGQLSKPEKIRPVIKTKESPSPDSCQYQRKSGQLPKQEKIRSVAIKERIQTVVKTRDNAGTWQNKRKLGQLPKTLRLFAESIRRPA